MDGVIVRSTEPDDAEAINAIAQCPRVRSGTLQMPYQSLESTRTRLAQQPEGMYRLVAEYDGKVVGEAGLYVQSRGRRRHVGELGMMVHDDFQGKGIGKALLRAIIDLADNWLNLHRLELDVYTDNAAGIHLYRSHGFVVEGTRADFAFRDGKYVDAYAMGRIRSSERFGSVDTDSMMV